MKNKNQLKKASFISLLLLVICSITIVCSSFDEEMLLIGEGMLRVDADIRIVGLKMNNVTNHAYETYNSKYSKNTTNIYVTLPELTSTITYQITVKNKTKDVYVISEMLPSIDNENITYAVTGYQIGQGIGPTADTIFEITFRYKDTVKQIPEKKSAIISINYTFIKPYAEIVFYDKTQSKSPCSDVQCALDDLYKILKIQ